VVRSGQIDLKKDLDVLINYDIPSDFDSTLIGRLSRLGMRLVADRKDPQTKTAYSFISRTSPLETLIPFRSMIRENDQEVPEFLKNLGENKTELFCSMCRKGNH
jgi:superfamily II DNA/RNA helicase